MLIDIINRLKIESNPEKIMNAVTGFLGLKTQDKEVLGEYTKSVEGLLTYAKAIKQTLTNLTNTNIRTQTENNRLNAEQDRAINIINIQHDELVRIGKMLENYNIIIKDLKNHNNAIQNTNKALTEQNETQQKQNEERNTINKALTAQNQAQQQQIAGMKENLAQLKTQLEAQTETLNTQTTEIEEINKSNADLNTQLKNLEATQRKTIQKREKATKFISELIEKQKKDINKIKNSKERAIAGLKTFAKNKLKKQQEGFEKSIAKIKENSKKSIGEKEAQIKKMTEEHTKAQNKINTQLNNIQATSNATIGDLRTELSKFKTEEQLGKEDQEKQKKMLRTVTRVFPLSWKNSKGFNIGNITTQLRGNKPYQANDTIDHYLHTLFNDKNQGQSEISISSRHVPIIKTSGGKKSKKSKKSKNNKTKKQRGQR